MITYLITGGAGFIGSNFIKCLLERKKEISIINLDKLTYAGSMENLKEIENIKNYTFIEDDICNSNIIKKIFEYYKPDYVVNFAAESHVDRSIKSSEEFIKTNVLGTQVLLDCSLNSKIKMFVQISTDEVYGSCETGFFTEISRLRPNNPYAASKASADLLAYSFYKTHGLPVIITRCTNNFGPNQHKEKLIPMVISNTLCRKEIPVYGKGTNIRDWIYVLDHCDAINTILDRGLTGEIYNIGCNNEKRNIDVIKYIINQTKKILQARGYNVRGINEGLIKFVEDRKGHDKRYGLNAEKLKSTLGWEKKTQFEYGMEKTIQWYIERNKNILKW